MRQLTGFTQVRLCSDLHLDEDLHRGDCPLLLDEEEGHSDSLLIIAGDIASKCAFVIPASNWLAKTAASYHSVVIVLGNHDYWGMDLCEIELMRGMIEAIPNCYLLHNEAIGNAQVKILGSTFWTDLSDPLNAWHYERGIMDSRFITHHGQRLTGEIISQAHQTAWRYIQEHAVKDNPDQILLVATHHAPASGSCDPRFKGDYLNACFFNQYDDWIAKSRIDYWLHGHVHQVFDYQLGACRVLCNPHGYYPDESGYTQDVITVCRV